MMSIALAAARWWLTGQMPHSRWTDDRDFPVGPPLDERLEAAKLDDVQAHLMDVVVLVEQDGDFAVAFDAGDRLDRDAAQRLRLLRRFRDCSFRRSAQS